MSFPILGSPKPAFFDSSGSPLVSGTLSILNPADDTNKAYYPTADDADAATNPASGDITLDARGETTTALFGIDNETYKCVLKDSAAAPIWTVDDVKIPAGSQSGIGVLLYPVTAAETSAGVTPTNYNYEPGDVRRYGTNTTPGTTDMGTALQAALNSNERVSVTESLLVTTEMSVSSTTEIIGIGKPAITFSGTMVASNLFKIADSSNDVIFNNLKLVGDQTANASGTTTGSGVRGNLGTRIQVNNCRITGFPQHGISLTETDYIQITDNEIDTIRPLNSSAGSIAGINVENDSDYVLLSGNHVHDIGLVAGSAGHGIRIIAQTSGNSAPTRVRCIGNLVEETQNHGILHYDNQNSDVTDSLGSVYVNNVTRRTGLQAAEFGNGIYVLNVSNIVISGNNIIDPHVNTTGTAISHAGIACSADTTLSIVNINVSGNTVENSGNHGIRLINVNGGSITGNVIDTWTENGIHITGATNTEGCTSVSVTGNSWINTNSTEAFVHGLSTGGVSSDCYAEVFAAPIRASNEEPFVRNYGTGCRVVSNGTALPNGGTWGKGDSVINTSPSDGSQLKWVCTVAGTAGTWDVAGQVGMRDNAGTPASVLTPNFIGEMARDTSASPDDIYIAVGTANTNWEKITP